MDIDRILDRINKLLSYTASNSTQFEFEAAQHMAQVLITKYQIDQAQLRISNNDNNSVTCEYVSMPHNTIMNSVLLLYIAEHNFCKVLRGDDCCIIYGYHDDIQICIKLYAILSLDMQRKHDLEIARAKSSTSMSSRSWSKSFYIGYCVGLDERLNDAKQSAMSTILSTDTSITLSLKNKQHEVEQLFQSVTADAKPGPSHTANSSNSGYIAGHTSGRNADIGQTRIEQ